MPNDPMLLFLKASLEISVANILSLQTSLILDQQNTSEGLVSDAKVEELTFKDSPLVELHRKLVIRLLEVMEQAF